jgi:hypothetical protein
VVNKVFSGVHIKPFIGLVKVEQIMDDSHIELECQFCSMVDLGVAQYAKYKGYITSVF